MRATTSGDLNSTGLAEQRLDALADLLVQLGLDRLHRLLAGRGPDLLLALRDARVHARADQEVVVLHLRQRFDGRLREALHVVEDVLADVAAGGMDVRGIAALGTGGVHGGPDLNAALGVAHAGRDMSEDAAQAMVAQVPFGGALRPC